MTIPSVLFIGKVDDPYCERAIELIETLFPNREIVLGKRCDKMPEHIACWKGDYILSYLSPWVIPRSLLLRAERAAINFHPGPPQYPGIGCTNFAIYNEEKEFGVTCHHMLEYVDAGAIIAVKRFPLYQSDTVWTLTQRCYAFILTLFHEIVGTLVRGEPLQTSNETWMRRPYKRKELNDLCRITNDMGAEEVTRRIRSVTYPNAPGAFIEVAGYKFVLRT